MSEWKSWQRVIHVYETRNVPLLPLIANLSHSSTAKPVKRKTSPHEVHVSSFLSFELRSTLLPLDCTGQMRGIGFHSPLSRAQHQNFICDSLIVNRYPGLPALRSQIRGALISFLFICVYYLFVSPLVEEHSMLFAMSATAGGMENVSLQTQIYNYFSLCLFTSAPVEHLSSASYA